MLGWYWQGDWRVLLLEERSYAAVLAGLGDAVSDAAAQLRQVLSCGLVSTTTSSYCCMRLLP